MTNVFWLNPILLAALLCCNSVRLPQSNSSNEDDCKIFSQEFSVDASTYKEFSGPISDFLKSENQLDIMCINMKGGNHVASEMTRWLVEDGIMYKSTWSQGKKEKDSIVVDNERMIEFAESIERGDFMQMCSYSTNNDSYLIMIKSNSEVKFKYTSTGKNYHALPTSERDKILNVINLLTYLNSL